MEVPGRVVPGHQIASGLAKDSPYPDGSIALQMPHFKAAGLDLSDCLPATINVSIAPRRFSLTKADFRIEALQWVEGFHPETFSFVRCELIFTQRCYPAWVYYPHPETKTQHFHNDSVLEILAPEVANLTYGADVTLRFASQNILFDR